MEYSMFESLEIRRAENGFILIVNTEDDAKEFVYDTERKLIRVVKQHLGEKITAEDQWPTKHQKQDIVDYLIHNMP